MLKTILKNPNIFNYTYLLQKRFQGVAIYALSIVIFIAAFGLNYIHYNSVANWFAGKNPNAFTNYSSSDNYSNANYMQIIYPAIIVFFYLQTLSSNILVNEIVEEKSSRAMEIIVTSISPLSHFICKLMLNLTIILVLIAWILFSFSLADYILFHKFGSGFNPWFGWGIANHVVATNKFSEFYFAMSGLHNSTFFIFFYLLILLTGMMIVFILIIGIVSIVSNSQDAQILSFPLFVIPTFSLLMAFFLSQNSLVINLFSRIPIFSSSFVPFSLTNAHFALTSATSIAVTSLIINLLTISFLTPVCALIYKQGILNYSEGNVFKQLSYIIKQLRYNFRFKAKQK